MERVWVSVEDRLPEDDENVLCFWGWGIATAAYSSEDGVWEGAADYAGRVTHWMPLPSTPQNPRSE